jgi:hypothetical protein
MYSFAPIWTPVLALHISDGFPFLALPVLRVFLDRFLDDSPDLAHSLASMHF